MSHENAAKDISVIILDALTRNESKLFYEIQSCIDDFDPEVDGADELNASDFYWDVMFSAVSNWAEASLDNLEDEIVKILVSVEPVSKTS